MKKIFTILLLIFLASPVFAQLKLSDPIQFTCGEYTFVGEKGCQCIRNIDEGKLVRWGAGFKTSFGDKDEAFLVYSFLKENKKKIEEKYNVFLVFRDYNPKEDPWFHFYVYDKTLKMKGEEFDRKWKEKEEREHNEKMKSMADKLNKINVTQ